jgi:pimeloyl-ACP methyl ester carboxylesterase
MQHVYCISGLGADSRIFDNLKLENAELHFIKWIEPDVNDTLPQFAEKLSHQIIHENPVLLGVSFGGMLATEITRLFVQQEKPVKTIIVSSCKCRSELPALFRSAGKINLHKALPISYIAKIRPLTKLVFGLQGSGQEMYVKQIMLQQQSPYFLKRCIHMIVKWKAADTPPGIHHIHGTADLLLPIKKSMNCQSIKKGTHFMIWNQADTISEIINKIL